MKIMFEPSVVKLLTDKVVKVWELGISIWIFNAYCFHLQKVKCHDSFTLVGTEEHLIFWGTRYGIPDSSDNNGNTLGTDSFATFANNTAAFTNFLTAVYKSETILMPKEILE